MDIDDLIRNAKKHISRVNAKKDETQKFERKNDEYETKMWEEESDTIPEMFFNNSFCNTRRVKKDVEEFLNNEIVQRILRDK